MSDTPEDRPTLLVVIQEMRPDTDPVLMREIFDIAAVWGDRRAAYEREECAKIAAPDLRDLYGPTHGAWDRGYQQGRIDAADAIRNRSKA